MHLRATVPEHVSVRALIALSPYSLASGSDAENDSSKPSRKGRVAAAQDDLPYRVELWDAEKSQVEQVLAVTAHGSIGYAAYYAATREYPDRYITLRHRNRTVAGSNTPEN
jgi:hypothetical protein